MQRAIYDGSHYYTLGYSPTDKKMDGSYREIEVRLKSGKDKLAYRHGYNAHDAAPPDSETSSDPLAALLVLGLPGASGVLFGAQMAAVAQPEEPSRAAGENIDLQGPVARYAVDFLIRAEDVSWQIDPNGVRSGKVLVGLKAYDRDGNPVNWEGSMQTLEAGADQYQALQKNGIPIHLELDLPPNKELRLVTAVYDWRSGKAGTLELPVAAKAVSPKG